MALTALIEAHGGPEQFKLVDLPIGEPANGEVKIAHKAAGLNYIDVYHRKGFYPLPMPHAMGMEGAGIVEAVGEGVTHLKVGDRVAYASQPPGSYCKARVMPAAQVCPLPDGISFEEGAAMMLKGMTVEYLFNRTTPLKAGDTVLFHAAAGGVGLLACQWARSEGITLIGTAGSDEKCKLAVANGAAHCINYRDPDWATQVKRLTNGKGVDVVMDAVGKDTFEGSLSSLKPLGMMISFGAASGPIPPFDVGLLGKMGSLKLTRPTIFTHIGDQTTCHAMAKTIADKVLRKDLQITIGQRFALRDVAKAHEALESRQTTGSTILDI